MNSRKDVMMKNMYTNFRVSEEIKEPRAPQHLESRDKGQEKQTPVILHLIIVTINVVETLYYSVYKGQRFEKITLLSFNLRQVTDLIRSNTMD